MATRPFPDQQDAPCPVERVVAATAVSGLLVLHRRRAVSKAVGQSDDVERVNDLRALGRMWMIWCSNPESNLDD